MGNRKTWKCVLALSLAAIAVIGMTACKKGKGKDETNATPEGSGTVDMTEGMVRTPSFELAAQSDEFQDILAYTGLDPEKTYTVIARISEKDGKDANPLYYTEEDFQPESPDGSFIMDLAAGMSQDKEYTCRTTLTEKGSADEIPFTRETMHGQDNIEFTESAE